jgi:hypothetical protein
MKLAEALIERADLQKQMAQAESRMKENAKVQEGDEPAECMERLFDVYEDLMSELEAIIIWINKTNHATPVAVGMLAEAITKRDCLKSRLGAYQRLYAEAAIKSERYSHSEIRFVRNVDMAKLQRGIDGLSKQYRELDTQIQALNWTVDLV